MLAKVLLSQKMPIKSPVEIEGAVKSLQSKTGVITQNKVVQKRPRCFQKDKVSKLYGSFTGPLVKSKKNGQGIFIWYDFFMEG